jgi:nicotinamide mononucleotide adenylyltransferase
MPRAKPFSPHPDIRSNRVGLAVADLQVVQWGHVRLLTELLGGCDTAIVALGSSQLHGVPGHPFTFDQKREMVQGIFGPAFKFVALQDIDASLETDDWINYVLSRIRSHDLPEPTDYYTGSAVDARHYTGHFASQNDEAVTNGQVTTYSSARTGRRLHIVDRSVTPHLQGREVRFLIENRDPDWKLYVPPKLWNYIERHYPPHLRTAIQAEEFPEDVPVGTRCILATDPYRTVQVLHDDGKWRPMRNRPDEKATWRPTNR